jgi:demethylmenaquinone methyltransferase/2-methoxy-6-polyprenyl-1,4-benzoquinol methylase
MFGSIAARYDILNTLMSFGMDQVLRRRVVAAAALPAEGRLLDVGAGTGKIALAARRRHPRALIVAADLTTEMMIVGRGKSGDEVLWCCADALNLPFPDKSFDAVTSGFLVRNVPDIHRAFSEQARVVRPGGTVVCLDTNPPPGGVLGILVRFHLDVVIPFLGTLLTGNLPAYRYLPESTKSFKTPGEVAEIMHSAGLEQVAFSRAMFGTMSIVRGMRPPEQKA